VYDGEGTEEKPFVVDWLTAEKGNDIGDPENPMSWAGPYKWAVTMSVAVATLAVAFASSCL